MFIWFIESRNKEQQRRTAANKAPVQHGRPPYLLTFAQTNICELTQMTADQLGHFPNGV